MGRKTCVHQINRLGISQETIWTMTMVDTRSSIEESQQRFQNLLKETLGLEVQSLIYTSLVQELIHTLCDLATLRDEDIKDLQYSVSIEKDNQSKLQYLLYPRDIRAG